MKSDMKLLPIIIMLVAGGITAISTFLLGYESKTALWILVAVLVIFYILGLIFRKILLKFEAEIAEKEAKLSEEEGKVEEKQNGNENEELQQNGMEEDAR